MSRHGNVNRGFTLIEVLVTTVLVGLAVVGVLTAIRAVGVTETRVQTADLLQRLAAEKLNDLRLLPDPGQAAAGGDFADRGYPDVTWELAVEQTDSDALVRVTVTASRAGASQELTTLMYLRPSTGAAGGAPEGTAP
ncbi:MAG: prepilin-type N-terminal cleavage/methylation domain-containing protein [Armatimonadetes bacterium]|nr:prepilin-type N-terminal cleavage/methylation domain-containing protein [Armatimonadota bacterium]